MEKEKFSLLHDRCWEVYEKSNLGESKKRFIFSRWYFSLTDEERDYLDASSVSFCVPYSRGILADRKRRAAAREAREREIFLGELKISLASLKENGEGSYEAAVSRAEKILPLFKIRLPMMTSFETCQESFEGDGWNACLMQAVKRGEIPEERASLQKDGNMTRAVAGGWNAARAELSRKFSELLKAA